MKLIIFFLLSGNLYTQTISGGGVGTYPKTDSVIDEKHNISTFESVVSATSFSGENILSLEGLEKFLHEEGPSLEFVLFMNEMIKNGTIVNPFLSDDVSLETENGMIFRINQTNETLSLPDWNNQWEIFPSHTQDDSLMDSWHNFDGMNNVIDDYENYINALKQTLLIPDMKEMNIYDQYIQLNKDRINRELVQKIYDYGNADPNTLFAFPRYQHGVDKNLDPVDNLNWKAAQEDIDKAVAQWWGNSSDFSTENQTNEIYIHGEKVSFNPYKKDSWEIHLNNGNAFNKEETMSFMRANWFSPSMVDVSLEKTESVIQNGWEISPDEMKKLQTMPFSVEINAGSGN